MSHALKTIFFDVGNTLLFPDWSVILTPLYQGNVVPTLEQWHAIERTTKREFDTMLEKQGHADHSYWYLFYSHLLDDLGLQDAAIRDSLVAATRISSNWSHLQPGTTAVLQRLGRRYRLGVISNADGKIAAVLHRVGIADCFETITDSGLVGYEKPHPAIFEAALRSLGASAGESLYVGDVHSVDYLGAIGVGMQAILFDVAGAYREDGLARVTSLEELEGKLHGSE